MSEDGQGRLLAKWMEGTTVVLAIFHVIRIGRHLAKRMAHLAYFSAVLVSSGQGLRGL